MLQFADLDLKLETMNATSFDVDNKYLAIENFIVVCFLLYIFDCVSNFGLCWFLCWYKSVCNCLLKKIEFISPALKIYVVRQSELTSFSHVKSFNYF